MPKSNQIQHLKNLKPCIPTFFSSLWVKPSSSPSLPMAPNQKTSQQKRAKTNCFLSCFGFPPKSSSSKKKPKKGGVGGRKKFFKLCWPKLKVITSMDKKNIIFDPKTVALKASHNIMLEATKVHQLKLMDHQPTKPQETNVLPKHKDNQSDPPKNQSSCDKCHKKDSGTRKAVKQSILADKVKKDSLIGVSMMVSMLMILSIWGRLCAILCMSAWLYCLPLFRTGERFVAPNYTDTKLGSTSLNSEMYKKKVVLHGLLQRDHKTAIGIS